MFDKATYWEVLAHPSLGLGGNTISSKAEACATIFTVYRILSEEFQLDRSSLIDVQQHVDRRTVFIFRFCFNWDSLGTDAFPSTWL